MNKIYKYLFLVLMIGLTACESTIKDDGKYHDADAVFLSMNKEYTLNVDGSQKYIYGQKLRLQSHASFNSMYGDSHIQYDPMFQKLTFLHSETQNSMGTSKAKENAFNDILPMNASHSAYYNRLREKVVSHMGTELGAVIDFGYNLESNKDYKTGLFEQIVIAQSSPVREMKIVVSIPSRLNLKFHLFNSLVRPKVEEIKDRKTYTWLFKDVKAIVREKGSPAYRAELPRLIFSTMTAQKRKDMFLTNELNIKDSTFFAPIVESIRKNTLNKEKLFLKIQKEVISNLSLNKISFKQASYRGRSPKQSWLDASASIYEESFILKDILNTAGYQAEVVVSVPKDLFIQAGINPDVWHKTYVSVYDGSESYLLRADKMNIYDSRYDIGECKLFNPITGDVKSFPIDTNSITVNGFIKMNTRKYIWGIEKVTLSGRNRHSFKEGDSKYFKSMMDNCTKLSAGDKDKRLYTIVDSISKREVKGQYFKYIFPEFKAGLSTYSLPVLTPDRKTSIDIHNVLNESYSYKLMYGKWYSTIKRDTSIIEENEVGKVVVSYENVLKTNSYIKYHRSISLKKRIIKVSEYNDFKRLIDVWNDKKNREVYFTFK